MPHLLYPFICPWTLRLLPCQGSRILKYVKRQEEAPRLRICSSNTPHQVGRVCCSPFPALGEDRRSGRTLPPQAPPTDALGPAASWTAEAGGGAHPCPRGPPGSANHGAPCWPAAAPAPSSFRRPPVSQNPRWRDPGKGVPGPELGRCSALCCCRSVVSSGATVWEATRQLTAPRAP